MVTPQTYILIENARLYTPSDPGKLGWLLVQASRIHSLAVGQAPGDLPDDVLVRIDAGGRSLLPGFIDLHVHGAMGYDVMDASVVGIEHMARYYAAHGVTAFLATTWTASRSAILAALHVVAQKRGRIPGGATLLGAYLEGPYLNPARCGAQDVRLIRRAEKAEALELLDSGVIRLLALAPEYPENLWLVDECIRRGITVSAAHTNAGFDQMRLAVEHGLSHLTHCFNAMQGLGHRELGTVGAAMALPQILCELIADNVHVHPGAQKILVDLKGPAGVVLVTDAIRAAGLPDGQYTLDKRTVTVHEGQVRLPDGTLAGSVLTMERALFNARQATGLPLGEIWVMSSLNAARAIGISNRKGSLEVGKDADLVLLDGDGNVCLTIAEGEIVFTSDIE